ncbi:MAG: ead/Ea22-like family protein [Janthinobacterium lividum]
MTERPTADLRKLAEAATPGPWHVDEPSCYIWGPKTEMVADNGVGDANGAVVRIRGVGGRLPIDANMAFIAAANPKAVLALLNENDGLRAEIVKLTKSMRAAAYADWLQNPKGSPEWSGPPA